MKAIRAAARFLLLASLLAAALPLFTPAAHAQHDPNAQPNLDPVRQKHIDDISQTVMCQCGCGLTVYNCGNAMGCSIGPQMKEQMGKLIDEGKSDGEIRDYFVGIYGEVVLATPKKEGFGLSAWIMPFVGVLAGAGLVGSVIYVWVRRRRPDDDEAEAAPASEHGSEPDLYRQLVERDLERLA